MTQTISGTHTDNVTFTGNPVSVVSATPPSAIVAKRPAGAAGVAP